MRELESLSEVATHIEEHASLADVAIQEVDFSTRPGLLSHLDFSNAFFLGCTLTADELDVIQSRGGYVFRTPPDFPYRPFRSTLYAPSELYDRFDPSDPCSYCECTDAKIYEYWKNTGRETVLSIVDAMYRGIHDRSINDALYEFLETTGKPVLAIMGGHSLERTSPLYHDIANMSRELSRRGYLMVSGGGPGAMEATHLGAMLAPADDRALDIAIINLTAAPSYKDFTWLSTAIACLQKLEDMGVEMGGSLGIPTWLYGHEPPTPFATHIAKFFNNSIREEGLVTVAHSGIIFAPGSAGTVQEVFQDAAQNHYSTTGYASPMVLLGKKHWTETQPVYPVLKKMALGRPYENNLYLVDDTKEVIRIIESSSPIMVEDAGWNFCDAFCND